MIKRGSCFCGAGVVIKIIAINKKSGFYLTKILLQKGVLEGAKITPETVNKLSRVSPAKLREIKTRYAKEFARQTRSDSAESKDDLHEIQKF